MALLFVVPFSKDDTRMLKRLTPDMIDGLIADEIYFKHKTLTICVLELTNGATVVGESNVISPELYDEGIGQSVARTNAREKIWQLEGYAMKTRG